MKFNKQEYTRLATNRAKRTPTLKNCIRAFISGGTVCAMGEVIYYLFHDLLNKSEKESSLYVCVILIGLSALLTCLGVFDNIAKYAGAGVLLPITGFANAVVSPAIDTKAEGFILGVGAKMFTIAGPVIVYGTVASVVYGFIYWICSMI